MSSLTLLLSFVLSGPAAMVACGGGAPSPPPEPVPIEAAGPTFPPLACPDGAIFRESQTPQGFEQVCETSGVLNGPFRRWHGEEIHAVVGNYKLGQPDGNWVWRYTNGKTKSKGSYRSGKYAGSWTWWDENGLRTEEGDFLGGRKAGTWIRWYPSERKRDEGMYHNGGKNGSWSYFRDDVENTVKRKEKWQAGAMAEEVFFDKDGKTKIDAPLPEDVEPEVEEVEDVEGGKETAAGDGGAASDEVPSGGKAPGGGQTQSGPGAPATP